MTDTPKTTCAGCIACGGPDCIERPEPVTPEQEAELQRLAATHEVRGHCPACGWTTLFLGDGGYLTCSRLECPAPDAASTLLETDPRTTPEAPTTNPHQAVTASDVLVQHDVTRKAMCDALGAGYHLNWRQIIDTAQRSTAANTEWQQEAEGHRRQLADALGLADAGTWPDMIGQVRVTRQLAADAVGLPAGALWAAIVDRAATFRAAAMERAHLLEEARDALEGAGQTGAHSDDWPAIAPAIRALAANRDQHADARRKDQCARKRERAVYEGRRTALATTLQRGPGADWHAIRAAAAEYVRRAEQAEATIARVRAYLAGQRAAMPAGYPVAVPANDVLAALGDDQPTKTEPKPREVCCICGSTAVVYHNYREQPFCGPCADGRRTDTEPLPVPVLDALVMETIAALRRALRGGTR